MNASLNGRFRFEIYSPDGTVELPYNGEWVSNTVVDSGLDMLFTEAQAKGTTAQVNASRYGFLVPMAWCRLSANDARDVTPSDPASWLLNFQERTSAQYTKTYPAIAASEARTTTTADFTVPVVNSNVAVTVASSTNLAANLPITITGAGYFIVVTVDSPTQVTVKNAAATVADGTVITSGAAISTYYPDAVNSVTYGDDATWIWADFQRTFVFPPSGVNRTWNGVGISNSAAQLDYLFSRIKLSPVITVTGEKEFRVIYQLRVKIPKATLAVDLTTVGGFNPDGEIKTVGAYSKIFGSINADGTDPESSTPNTIPHILRGNGAPGGYLLSNAAFPAANTNISPTYSGVSMADSTANSVTPAAYTAGNFYRDYTLSWLPGRPAATQGDVRSIFLGDAAAPTAGIQWLLSGDQTKEPDKSLTPTIRIAWARP